MHYWENNKHHNCSVKNVSQNSVLNQTVVFNKNMSFKYKVFVTAHYPHTLFESAGSPSIVKRGSPISVYLFPGEAPKSRSFALEGVECELDQLVVTATEVHADIVSEECSEGSTDNDDFCILEAPGIGIPVSVFCLDYFCFLFIFLY